MLSASDVTAGYGPQPVIHDISLEVRPGEVVALLGANGAGKTTTLLALSGELPIMGGDVRLRKRQGRQKSQQDLVLSAYKIL